VNNKKGNQNKLLTQKTIQLKWVINQKCIDAFQIIRLHNNILFEEVNYWANISKKKKTHVILIGKNKFFFLNIKFARRIVLYYYRVRSDIMNEQNDFKQCNNYYSFSEHIIYCVLKSSKKCERHKCIML